MKRVPSAAGVALGVALTSTVLAADVSSDPAYNGWGRAGDHSVEAVVSLRDGRRPDASASAPERYQRFQGWVFYQYYAYHDKTRFDTLVGGEIGAGVGYVSPEVADPVRSPEPSKRWVPLHFRSEGAFDFAVVHWQGTIAGRLLFGAGAGFEIGSNWYSPTGQAYPLVLGRFQLFLGSSGGLHLTYHLVPITSDTWKKHPYRVMDHRGDALLSLGRYHLGAQVQYSRLAGALPRALTATTIGIVAGVFL
jgi:hypothetical protein